MGNKGHIKSRCKSKKPYKSQKANANSNKNAEGANNVLNKKHEGQTPCTFANECEQANACKMVIKPAHRTRHCDSASGLSHSSRAEWPSPYPSSSHLFAVGFN